MASINSSAAAARAVAPKIPEKPKPKFYIHPSIDTLAGSIKEMDAKGGGTPEAVEVLRETCIKKLRSYKLDDYLKRFATEPEKVQARLKWETVIEFANRRKNVSTG